MLQILERLMNEKLMKKQLEEIKKSIQNSINKARVHLDELDEALKRDDLSFLPLLFAPSISEAEICKEIQRRGVFFEEGVSMAKASCEEPPVDATLSPTTEVQLTKKRGKRIKDLFLDAAMSVKWVRLCKEFFAPNVNDEIDASLSNRVLQRFAWFLSVWQEWGLLVAQLFSPAVRFLQALGFRLVISFQTCTNVLRRIFAHREDYPDAKSEVLAFCMEHA